ncbi:M23 family metallopeptidase [Adhaeribacter rhizoryzae]|uniref:M23 family metallopeptidase n=1 Tax=Adhaeribacter rhizoryzae TaxID=2607907 RepID=A0A5M6D9W8_9BACT|nr:M23 family metallopeptidase [Adhaeribacter rhizoryzae]KAA5541985.1 M23 family metallopeptidase [Adhaeribacter rhizoryzae]
MQQYLKYFALIFLLPAKSPLLAQGIPVGKDSVLELEISEREKWQASPLWLEKQVIQEEIKKFAYNLLRYAVTYRDIFNVLRITHWDAALIQNIPSLVPIQQAQIKNFKITSGFGYREHPINGEYRFHGGIDIPAPHGTPVYAVANVIVNRVVKFHYSLGNFIQLNHLNGFITIYGHLLRFIVFPRQVVKQGQVIGYVGQSGLSTGNHLHYILIKNGLPLDPYPFCFLMYDKFKAEKKRSYSGSSK